MLIADVDSLHVKRNMLVGMNYLSIIDSLVIFLPPIPCLHCRAAHIGGGHHPNGLCWFDGLALISSPRAGVSMEELHLRARFRCNRGVLQPRLIFAFASRLSCCCRCHDHAFFWVKAVRFCSFSVD